MIVKALAMLVPEFTLQRSAENKRVKKGILGGSEERIVFHKILYLPYLDFTYQYSAEKGFLSKQTVPGRGRSVVMALREADFGFDPELAELAPQLVDQESDSDSIIAAVDSIGLVRERLDALREILSEYDNQLLELARHYDSLAKTNRTREDLKENIDHLKASREMRWKIFADGLKLPSRIDLDKLELLQGNLFYMPYFIAQFSRGGESRFLVWDREGREDEVIADELVKNGRFRELVQSHALVMSPDDTSGQ